jgi:hypothetical protein
MRRRAGPIGSVPQREEEGPSDGGAQRIVEGEEVTAHRGPDGTVARLRGGGGATLEPETRSFVPRSRG